MVDKKRGVSPGYSLASRTAALGCALRGITVLLRQPNARIHAVAACVATGLGATFKISVFEWVALVLVIGAVVTAEALNTALELAVDLAEPEWHALARDAKDVAAGGVLVSSIAAVIVGLLIFVPNFKAWL